MKLSKKLAVFSISTAMVAGVAFVAPAHAATKDLAVGMVLDIDKLDPHTATSFATVKGLGLVYGSLVELGPKPTVVVIPVSPYPRGAIPDDHVASLYVVLYQVVPKFSPLSLYFQLVEVLMRVSWECAINGNRKTINRSFAFI